MTNPHVSDPVKVGAAHAARWKILGFLGVAQLMLILDVTVVALALPHIQTDLDLGRESLTWTVSAYTLTFGGLMLLGGRLADIFGARRILLTGLTLFTAASLMAGFSTSAETLLLGRVGQGAGAALISPAALSLVISLFEGEDRNRALGVWSALGGGGAALGVLVGGLLTAGPGWGWVFWVNVPIGAVILVALMKMLPPGLPSLTNRRLDVLGAGLVTASSVVLIFAFVGAGDTGWFAARTGVLVAASAIGFALFVAWQRTTRIPLMDVRMLVRRPVATGTFLILVATALMVAVFFLGTFYFQHGLGYGPMTAGLLFLPVALATMAGAHLTGRLLTRLGVRTLAVAGLGLAAAGMAVPAISLQVGWALVGVVIAAAGTGALFVVASATALGQVAPHEAGIASGIVSTSHELGASIGASVISSVAAVSLTGATDDGFTRGFGVAAVAAAASALIAFALTPGPPPTDRA